MKFPSLILQLRQVRAGHAEELETQRRAAEAHTQQRLIAHEAQITSKLKEEHKRKMTQVCTHDVTCLFIVKLESQKKKVKPQV